MYILNFWKKKLGSHSVAPLAQPRRLCTVHNVTYFMRNETRLFDGSRKEGAILLDNLEIPNMDKIYSESGEGAALLAEFKIAVNDYLEELETSPVRSLADLIAFNKKNSDLVRCKILHQNNISHKIS